MSVDVLFTEAAEAGGPPRFTEDDVERRVGTRRRRRRALAGTAAVAVVLFAGGLAVSLANRETPDEVVAGPAGEVRIVPFDEAALVGEWVALDPTDQIDGEVTVAFRADGTYTQTGCNGASGQWLINRGHLTIGGGPTPSRACPGTGLQAVDSTFASGVPTLYSDGLLHFATDSFALDFVRTDAAPPADPTAPRPPAPTPTPTDMATVAGLWVVADVEPDGTPIDGSLQLDADGDTLFDGCGQDPGRWSVEAGRVVLQFYSGGGGCPDETLELISDHPVYTDADQLLLIDRNYGGGGWGDPEGTIALQRAGPAPVPLAGTRWVATGSQVEPYVLRPWLDFSSDGVSGENGWGIVDACGRTDTGLRLGGLFDGVGEWSWSGDFVTFRLTGEVLPACPETYTLVESVIEGVESGRLTEDGLVLDHYPEVIFRRLDDLGSTPTAGERSGLWYAGTGAFLVDSGGSLRPPPCDDASPATGNCPSIPDELAGQGISEFRLDGDRLYVIGPDVVAVASRAAPTPDP